MNQETQTLEELEAARAKAWENKEYFEWLEQVSVGDYEKQRYCFLKQFECYAEWESVNDLIGAMKRRLRA